MKKVYCKKCNFEFINTNKKICPKCGCINKVFVVSIEDHIKISDELDATVHDSQKNIKYEHINRNDSNISASISSDKNIMGLSIESKKRIDNFAEESDHTVSFVNIFNKINDSSYEIIEKVTEDYDYSDRTIKSEKDYPSKLYIQITHFDKEIIAKLGITKEFKDNRTIYQLLHNIRNAIKTKSRIDEDIKTHTILLLIIPCPIGQLSRKKIKMSKIQKFGFKEIWISPFHEVPFQINNLA